MKDTNGLKVVIRSDTSVNCDSEKELTQDLVAQVIKKFLIID
jgi:hypothetical protein